MRDKLVPALELRQHGSCQTWTVNLRVQGQRRRVKLGRYPAMPREDARRLARRLLADHALAPAAATPTLNGVMTRYWSETRKKISTRKVQESVYRSVIQPALGNRKVADISRDDVRSMMDSNANRPVNANRALDLLRHILGHCEAWGHINGNPCRMVQRHSEQARRRYLSDDERASLMAALDQESDQMRVYVLACMMTGARPGEWISARWDDIQGRVLVLRDSKTGAGRIPLPTALLNEMDVLSGNDGPFTGLVTRYAWARICKRAGLSDLHLHDLRHSFASRALSAGYTLDQIAEVLRHKSVQTTRRYAHLMEDHGVDMVDSLA